MNAHEQPFARANDVMQATQTESGGDTADQADRLSMIMEAEAIQAALHGQTGEGSLEGYSYPLEDTEEVLSMEEAEDGSNDPRHSGEATRWQTAEESAIHVIGTKVERLVLTPEDETLLGIDPYDS